jgi:molybdopterin converting factor subunit 1
MKLQLLAFGIAKDILGQRSMAIEVEAPATVSSLLRRLEQEYPAFNGLVSLRVAVNTEYVEEDHQLKEADEVVLIPPVSGG